jgi:hypothetical protein
MRILGYCMLAIYVASWPLVDSAFLLQTRPPTAVVAEPGPTGPASAIFREFTTDNRLRRARRNV